MRRPITFTVGVIVTAHAHKPMRLYVLCLVESGTNGCGMGTPSTAAGPITTYYYAGLVHYYSLAAVS